MNEIRITIRCKNEPNKHAKILRLEPHLGMDYAEGLAGLLDGTSRWFIHKPGPDSPIGKCAICGGELTSEVQDWRKKDAEKTNSEATPR